MDDDGNSLFHIGAGALAAIALGAALMPLRGALAAAGFTYAFLALTVVMAELGGGRAAVATALTSALSLDFFLTRPYLQLAIEGKDDVIAFLGLAACGLVVAAFASRRQRAAHADARLCGLTDALAELETAGPLETRAARLLEGIRRGFPVAAAALYDAQGRLIAGSGTVPSRGPLVAVEPVTLQAVGAAKATGREPLAPAAQLVLVFEKRVVGRLDLWGDGTPAGPNTRRALTGWARVAAALVASAAPAGLPAAAAPG